uniref:Peptidase M20 dimerisation domain-containing protein n=1 Tax=Araucaria cunninghamii TaxID=56994 RepID=A0A0D6QS84_ARACU
MNLQPSEAEAGFDIRVSPGTDAESFERRIAEEWAPASRNMTFQFKQKEPIRNKLGLPLMTIANPSNPWWTLLEGAILRAGGKLQKPEIFPAATDARFVRGHGIPAFGFSPMANTPILLHDHNEFLNEAEYLKGIKVYEAIIESYASYMEAVEDRDSLSEL